MFGARVVCCRHGAGCGNPPSFMSATSSTSESVSTNRAFGTSETASWTTSGALDTTYCSVNEDLTRISIPKSYLIPQPSIPPSSKPQVHSLRRVLNRLNLGTYSEEESEDDKTVFENQPVQTREPKLLKNKKRQTLFQRYFIGCKTTREAEAVAERRTSFRLYYLLPLNAFELAEEMSEGMDGHLSPTLPLYVVYRRADGRYNHYRIMSTTDCEDKQLYFVQYGDLKAPQFRSVERLLAFYNNYVVVQPGRKGTKHVDVFPYCKHKTGI